MADINPKPDFSFELSLYRKYSYIIGVDEVGRGAFAGPVVVGACALKPQFYHDKNALSEILSLGIDDSKLLKPFERLQLAKLLPSFFYWQVAETDVGKINKLGIVVATQMAARLAIKRLLAQLKNINCFLLCDAFPIPFVKNISQKKQLAITRGDQKSITIAAASIMAKVYRDRLMKKLARNFRLFQWGRNKGYGTPRHRSIISQYGMTILHRTQFVETWLQKAI